MKAAKRFLGQFQIVRDIHSKIRGPQPVPPDVDLRAIEAKVLPPNRAFLQLAASSEKIEGMLSAFSMAAVDMMLSFQEGLGANGSILEIGTYRGKSAVILGGHLRGAERLVLVDINDYLDRSAIEPTKQSTDFILTPSERLRSALPNYRSRRGSFRFIHIDASHGYEETFQELGMADELLGPLGIIALDDFTNLNYSQNIAGIYKYLFTTDTKLTPLVVTDEKAYLCRRGEFDLFAPLVLNTALAEMKSRGIDPVLARTSYGPEYKAFYLRGRLPEEEGGFYGESIYKNAIIGAG